MTPILLQAIFWVVLPLSWAGQDRALQGEAGRDRLLAMGPGDARALASQYRSVPPDALLGVVGTGAGIGVLLGATSGEGWPAAVALAVVVSCVYATLSRQRTAAHVLAVLAERDDEPRPPPPEDRSARRRRRTRQLLIAAAALYAAGTATLVVAASWDSTAWTAIGWTFVAAATVALVGAGWARAWRYGDEEPVTD